MRRCAGPLLIVAGCVMVAGSVGALLFIGDAALAELQESAGRRYDRQVVAASALSKLSNNNNGNGNGTDSVNYNKAEKEAKHNELGDNITMSLEEFIADDRFGARRPAPELTWLDDESFLLRDSQNGNYLNITTTHGESDHNVDKDAVASSHHFLDDAEIRLAVDDVSFDRVEFNRRGRYAAVFTRNVKLFRHSRRSTVIIVELSDVGNGAKKAKRVRDLADVQLFEWGASDDFFFVEGNRLSYCANVVASPSRIRTRANDTAAGEFLYEGVADWVYEEEIFGSSKAFWLPEDNTTYAAFMRLDDCNVTKAMIPNYRYHQLFPTYTKIPYPTAGAERIPSPTLWLWRHGGGTIVVPTPSRLRNEINGTYLFWAAFAPLVPGASIDQRRLLLSVWANRAQNLVVLYVCVNLDDKASLNCHTLRTFDYFAAGFWAEPAYWQIRHFSAAGGFFVVLPEFLLKNKSSTSSTPYGFDVIAHIDLQTSNVTAWHRADDGDVMSIDAYDRHNDVLYFSAGHAQRAGETHLYRIATASGASNLAPQCVSCLHNDCALSRAQFAPDATRFLLECSRPFAAERNLFLKRFERPEENIPIEEHWFPNFVNRTTLIPPTVRFHTVNTTNQSVAYVRVIFSPTAQTAKNVRRPVLLHVYGGPNSALALAPASVPAALLYLAVVQGAFIIAVDGRGAARHGWPLRAPLRENFGRVDVDDQLAALKKVLYLYADQVDVNRVAVFGWSYGGFASLSIAKRDAGALIRCVVAVAPVTDFRQYDTAYTERYMGVPRIGDWVSFRPYARASLLGDGGALADVFGPGRVKLFLAHGLADDNVHYGNSAQLAAVLHRAGVHFRQQVYTNEDHSLANVKSHFYAEFLEFLNDDCWHIDEIKS